MNVAYIEPARRSMERVRRMLFGTFRIETWLVLGFAAFLSEWMSGSSFTGGGRGGGGGGHTGFHVTGKPADLQPALDWVRDFLHNPFWMGLLVWLVLAAMVVAIVFMYVGARGKFIFLDDVVRERAAIVEPWSRFGRLANSLFFFRLTLVILLVALVLGVIVLTTGPALREMFLHEPDITRIIGPLLGTIVLLCGLALAFAVVFLLLDAFVVPIMYRHGIGVTEAWRRFLPLLSQHSVGFLVYAIMVLLLSAITVGLLVTVGLVTCCVGFVLMVMPYIGQVVLLPVHVFFRGLGPEFLAQFGPEWDVFAATRQGAPAAPPVAPAVAPGPPA